MVRGSFAAGAMFASLAAGPVFVASMALATWATAPPAPLQFEFQIEWVYGIAPGWLIVTFFGFLLSIIPNVIGAWFMHGLGINNFAARMPVSWALAGAGMAGLPLIFLTNFASDIVTTGMALTGSSCALVAHRFTKWPVLLAPRSSSGYAPTA